MRIVNFTGKLIIVTSIGLLYVHQQLTLVKLSYMLRENQKVFSDSLDQTNILEYNIASLKSPNKVEKTLVAKQVDLVIPPVWQVVKISAATPENSALASSRSIEPKRKAFAFFALKRVAVADTINSEK